MENLSVRREVCDKMKGYNKIMEVLEKYLSCIILVFITFEIFIQIVFREIGLPLGWTEETAALSDDCSCVFYNVAGDV